jgi:glycosyltransferase involved in cell wall biosynthesis
MTIEVLTPRYAATWPETFSLREITVHQHAAAPRSDWSMGRYVRHITSWLKENAKSYDLIYTDAIRDETIAIIDAARGTNVATLARAAGWGNHSDAFWWNTTRAAGRCLAVAKQCDGVIAKCAADHRELISRGVSSAKVHRIDNGFLAGQGRSSMARSVARQVLSQVNGDLQADIQAPVMLCMSRMNRASGIEMVASCVRTMVARFPELKIWFVGDGPNREHLYARMRSDGVRSSFSMPGTFLDTDDLMTAADVFLQADDEGLDHFLPAAVSAELPIIAVRTDAVQTVLSGVDGAETDITWFEAEQSKSLNQAVRQVIENLPERRTAASNLRRLLIRQRPQLDVIDAHTAIMNQLVEAKSGPHSRSSIEVAS